MSNKLFEGFPPVSTEEWMATVTKDLKGADFEKRLVSTTLDGIRLKPFYRAEDLPDQAPRPLDTHIVHNNNWILREEIREPDLTAANHHALACLARGAHEIAVYTGPIGPAIRTDEDMRAFLHGIHLDHTPIHWLTGPLSLPTLGLVLNEASRRRLDLRRLRGSIDLDPLMDRCAKWTASPLESWRAELVQAVQEITSHLPQYRILTIRGALIEKAGASLAQELAFSIGIFAEYLVELKTAIEDGRLQVPDKEGTEALAEIVGRSEIRLGLGTHYFLEIAKLRAAKVLLRNVLAGFGVTGVMPKLHAITTSSNKTLYDPYNNLLRATVEATSAVVAGVDSLTVACYDQGYDAPDEFSAHLARNTDTLLKEEALLDKVKDPLGGSYTVEALTRSLCEASWSIFQEIERRGGFEAAWKDGYIPGELDRIRVERGNLVSGRRRSIVGTTVYPNMKERRLEDVNWHGPRLQTEALPSGWTLATLPSPAALVGNVHTPTTALDPFRPSWPYENLRLRLERHMALGGKQPVILLALYGDPTFSRARAGFCLSLFGSAGYEVREHSFDHPEAIGDVVRLLGPDAVVLCAKDDEYLPAVRKIRCAVPLVIAGYPKDAVEELRAAGATDFVHVRQDLLETLSLWHQRFGIPEIPVDQPIDPRTK